MLALRFDMFRRWLLVVFVTDIWIAGLAQLVRVDVRIRRRRLACRSIVCVKPFALCKIFLRRLMYFLDGCFPIHGASFLDCTGVRIVKKCERCQIDRHYVRNAVFVDGERMLLHADSPI